MDFFVVDKKYFDQRETKGCRNEWLIQTSHSCRPSRMVDRYHGSQVITIIDIKNVVKNFGQNILKERDLLEE
jgi:hypothetical protein